MPASLSEPSVNVLTIPPLKFESCVHRWLRLFVTAACPFEYLCQSSEFSMRCTLATRSPFGTGRLPRSRVVIWAQVESSNFWKTSMSSGAVSVVKNALLGTGRGGMLLGKSRIVSSSEALFNHKRGIGSIGAFFGTDITLPMALPSPPPSAGGAGRGQIDAAAPVKGVALAGIVAGSTATLRELELGFVPTVPPALALERQNR
mmetsp:Transcript_10630/g.24205  ORF Transcript_10630/g.24205 Transcript_10630/m.24205 type:complete len:203 (+) Transcript_10630:592-1200(+)